jgi:hypothetical protein
MKPEKGVNIFIPLLLNKIIQFYSNVTNLSQIVVAWAYSKTPWPQYPCKKQLFNHLKTKFNFLDLSDRRRNVVKKDASVFLYPGLTLPPSKPKPLLHAYICPIPLEGKKRMILKLSKGNVKGKILLQNLLFQKFAM